MLYLRSMICALSQEHDLCFEKESMICAMSREHDLCYVFRA